VSSTDVLYGATEGCFINFCDDDDVMFHKTTILCTPQIDQSWHLVHKLAVVMNSHNTTTGSRPAN